MVGRLLVRQRQLVVKVVTGQFREAAEPTWSHSSAPFGPWPGPPTPTQPATWPLRTLKPPSGVTVAAIPNAGDGCGKTGVAVAAGAAGER